LYYSYVRSNLYQPFLKTNNTSTIVYF